MAQWFLSVTAVGNFPGRIREPSHCRLNTGWWAGPREPEDCLWYPRKRGLPVRDLLSWASVGGLGLGVCLVVCQFICSSTYCFVHPAKQSDPRHLGYEGI